MTKILLILLLTIFIKLCGQRKPVSVTLARENVNLMHIPKTSGTSFYMMFKNQVKFSRVSPGDNERCYNFFKNKNDLQVITFLREPKAHLLSQYIFCRYSEWGKSVTKNFWDNVPEDTYEGFDKWLDLTHTKKGQSTKCYYPFNMQTRFLLCDKYGHYYIHALRYSVREAVKNLRKTHFGLTEYFRESVCLIKYELGMDVPLFCRCPYKHLFNPLNVRHGAPKYTIDSVLDKSKTKMFEHIEFDLLLYSKAKNIFFYRLNDMQKAVGYRVYQCS